MNLEAITDLLYATTGITVESVGKTAIERAVSKRMKARSLEDTGDYWQLICLPGGERQQLVEAIIVPETWFFRDPQSIVALLAIVQPRCAQLERSPVRILSLPCSSGEEPYSIAMALLDAGIDPRRFQIDAIDISEAVLARAGAGIYGSNAFRGSDLAFRDRHFNAHAEGFQLHQRVRELVRFRQGNLLDPLLFQDSKAYTAIFCRNLLIYFDRAAQNTALAALSRALDSDAVLFVAPSEAGVVMQSNFDSIRVPMASGYRKRAAQTRAKVAAAAPPASRASTRRLRLRPAPVPQPAAENKAQAPTCPSLNEARALADSGDLAAAASICRRILQARSDEVEAIYLLGLVYDAMGRREDAAANYRKVLYLAPTHCEALIHLAFLLEHQGDGAGAQRLRARAARAAR